MRSGLVLSALLLAACCTQPALPHGDLSAEPTLTVTADGIEGIRGQVPFTLPAIERAFAGFEVVAAPQAGEPAFLVRERGSHTPVFKVNPDWTRGHVGAIAGLLPGDGDGLEVRAGITPASALIGQPGLACEGDQGLRDGPLICTAALPDGTLQLHFPAGPGDPLLEEIAYFALPAGE